jgi:hypothetical protein
MFSSACILLAPENTARMAALRKLVVTVFCIHLQADTLMPGRLSCRVNCQVSRRLGRLRL